MSHIDSLTEFLAWSEVQIVVRLLIASVIVLSSSVLISLFWLAALAVGPESVQID